jgi:hypothetical protein
MDVRGAERVLVPHQREATRDGRGVAFEIVRRATAEIAHFGGDTMRIGRLRTEEWIARERGAVVQRKR